MPAKARPITAAPVSKRTFFSFIVVPFFNFNFIATSFRETRRPFGLFFGILESYLRLLLTLAG
jgi:hypothetical protein